MKKIIYVCLLAFVFVQCTHETVIPDHITQGTTSSVCDSDTVYFVNDVLPLIMSSCATTDCHDDQTAEDGVRLTSFANIINTGEVKPFDPEDSELYEVLFEEGDDLMPPSPNSPFTAEQKAVIKKWILQGARNNECQEDCNFTEVTYTNDIAPIIANNCLGCHGLVSPNGGISLTNYSEVAAIANSGLLKNVLLAQNGAPIMPPSIGLNDCNIDKISKWIEDGTPNN